MSDETSKRASEETEPLRRSDDPKATKLPVLRVVYSGDTQRCNFLAHHLEIGRATLGRDPERPRGIRLSDRRVSRVHAAIRMKADGTAVLEDASSSNGTFINGKRLIGGQELSDGDALRLGDTLLIYRADDTALDESLPSIVGGSPEARRIRSEVALFGPSSATIMLLGKTGTGKEVVARALHEISGRDGPFVAINCSAIPETLAESQFFGHMAGSFTGAKTNEAGFFRASGGGTLFLDELGDLPASIQPKLLRALEERTVSPLGSTEELPFDVRVICATESQLRRASEREAFRGALYARLAEVTIELPPLSERREDILELFSRFLDEQATHQLSPALAEALLLYHWPFNVRELRKVAVEISLRARRAKALTLDMIRHRLPGVPDYEAGEISSSRPLLLTPTEDDLRRLLAEHGGNISIVARETGRSRTQVYRWHEQLDIDPKSFRSSKDSTDG